MTLAATVAAAPHHGRAIAAAAVGNAFEWYDFSVYVLFAPFIAHAFFPGGSPTAELVKAFLAFGIGFIARPIGAVLIGYYGDRAGRKQALTLTFGLMAAGTLVIALAPTHATIGVAAPLLILFGRLLQGLSAGGEIGGAAAFLVEHAPAGRKAAFAAWLQASMAFSNILGAVVALVVRAALPAAALQAWGWRLPFLFGLLIVPVGVWLRRTLDETPEFKAVGALRARPVPVRRFLTGQGTNLARGFGISVLWGVCVYALIIFMPVYYQKPLGFSARQAFAASLVGNVVLIGMCFVSGTLADRLGRRRLLTVAAAALLAGAPALMTLLVAVPSTALLLIVHASFGALVGLYSGAVPAILAELYPAPARATAMSVAYNAAVTIFAGFAPAIITMLSLTAIGVQAPTLYVSFAALAALVAIRSFPAPGG